MDVRYPIGKFEFDGRITSTVLDTWISELEQLPSSLREAVKDLNEEQLDTPYREGGWTIRQVVHHLADTSLNYYVRIKLALTEENPVIATFEESRWAELPDNNLPVEVSLSLLEALHIRFSNLLRNLSPYDFNEVYTHPVSGEISLGYTIGLYAWHGKHHLAQITSLCERKGWA
ncbi:DinB superfamily [Schinkia azotoformans MEV2011]|uniref:Putative metal-dependent hydrolase M670_02970 n=1 Tax=Schinkia azotoformans MEV2011 TaxID=1348973 RepID=A0A072NL91_SCHAZ|nr:putative metal-dependent hydrolase [Schinkia azotoformans]KEF37668.1 DinB superfamily [Schinkia azotoformans MEV2011]MEC1697948.1 putative metal-dependent hydrolase [Schinkia azotoformans]MEC1717117.1 putative metal-dependent hydrolase [Schinkia azotoformans]MEC1725176.1 putative metal-dependent hydrolase [Schinkia azotoformans]MEC1741931.1 putative metal-dependent hydrolase [Schinkia azotoformans]